MYECVCGGMTMCGCVGGYVCGGMCGYVCAIHSCTYCCDYVRKLCILTDLYVLFI